MTKARNLQFFRSGLPRLVAAFVLFLVALAWPSGLAGAAELHHAAVIVHHGNGGVTYAYVSFSEDQLDGAELLQRANLGAVTVAFGGLGAAVCIIEKEGCPPSVCEKKVCQSGSANDPFWHFYELDATGAWVLSPLGASAAKIHDGDVTGWSWTGSAPDLPAVTFPQVQLLAQAKTSDASGVAIWRTGPAPKSDSGQPSWVFAAAAILVTVAVLLTGYVILRKRRPVTPENLPDE